MSKQGKSPTMKDVAREAGVALGTVSKVFNGIPVGKSYRERVEAAAERLGYRVNSYARGLRASKTNTVALILPSTDHMFFALLADSVCDALAKRDYRLVLAMTRDDPRAEARCIQMVRQNKVDGIIGLTYSADLDVGDDLPYVSIDRFISPSIPCVSSDNFAGGGMAAEKLAQLGCRRLLFLRIGSHVAGEADKRGAGFISWCQEHDMPFEAMRFDDRNGMEPVYDCLSEHFSRDHLDFDGIFCNTDLLAYRTRKHLEGRGVRVPEDVQIIGFDGIRGFNMEGDLFCSTIIQPVRQMAETAVNILLNGEQSGAPALICLPVRYAPGGTTREPLLPSEEEAQWQANI